MGKYYEAIKAYDEAIQLDPNDAAAWYNKGVALDALGKTTEANAAFTEAKEQVYSEYRQNVHLGSSMKMDAESALQKGRKIKAESIHVN